MSHITIGNEFLDFYIDELKQYQLNDLSVTRHQLFQVLKKIDDRASKADLFNSSIYFLTILIFLNLLCRDGIIHINTDGAKFNQDVIFSVNYGDIGLDVISNKINSKIENDVLDFISELNINPNLEFYQSYNTQESLQRRFRVMNAYGDTQVNSAIFIGDDELFSVYYAAHTERVRIAAVDIDENILQKIRLANQKFNLNIETYSCDIIKNFPKQLLHSFDVFFASGLKDYGGLLLFLYSGLLSLNEEGKKSGYITLYNYNEKGKNHIFPKLQKQLIIDGCHFDFWGPCDQAVLPRSFVDHAYSYIQQGDFAKNFLENKEEIITLLRNNNPFSADPLFPYFAIKPIQIARICACDDMKKIEKALRVIQKFHV